MTTHSPTRSHTRRSTALLWVATFAVLAALNFGAPALVSLVAGILR